MQAALVILLGALLAAPAFAARANTQVFGVVGDWGGIGGIGDPNLSHWTPGPRSCPMSLSATFGTNLNQMPACVQTLCGIYAAGSDSISNCQRAIQQWQAAYFMDKVCAVEGCQFMVNTGDNFYIYGCNGTSGAWGADCNTRFKQAYTQPYHTAATPAIKGLTWYSSLGNHDVLGYIEGVDMQTSYNNIDPTWVMPYRYYAKTVGSGASAINLVVVHSSCFVSAYFKGKYGASNETQTCQTPAARQEQLDWAESALQAANAKPGWTVVVCHHPPMSSGDGSSFFQPGGDGTPADSTAWQRLRTLVQTYQPAFVLSGHDHTVSYSTLSKTGTRFVVSGAGGTSEIDGYNSTSNNVVNDVPHLVYSSVTTKGYSSSGFVVMTSTPYLLSANFYVATTGTTPQFQVRCSKRSGGGFNCANEAGPARPNYVRPDNYPAGL